VTVALTVDGQAVALSTDRASLLEALRDELGIRSPKDGCSPQGQCGCCTVLVDGAPRVACVTPVRRVAGREVTTLDGFGAAERERWALAFSRQGASQCGFCTPGILVRLMALSRGRGALGADDIEGALIAHLCRCTGWRTIVDAAMEASAGGHSATGGAGGTGIEEERDLAAAARRAMLEGGAAQRVGAAVVFGEGGFAEDTAPRGALVAVPGPGGGWVVGESLTDARAKAGKVQGRRTGSPLAWPLAVAEGDWAVTLRTTWVEPAYLEPDASWCEPGAEPRTPLANGGGFGGKVASETAAVARQLADRHGRCVRVVLAREDVVRRTPKRPPIAAGVRADGTGVMRVVRTPGIAEAVAAVAPGLVVEEVDVAGPPTSSALRAAGWAEAVVLLAAANAVRDGAVGEGIGWAVGRSAGPAMGSGTGLGPASSDSAGVGGAGAPGVASPGPPSPVTVVGPSGGWATASVSMDGSIAVHVCAGAPLDEVVLRSYCVGAAHQALGWVTSEGIAVDAAGVAEDLTIRSFGVIRARDMPAVRVSIAAPGTPAPTATGRPEQGPPGRARAREAPPREPVGVSPPSPASSRRPHAPAEPPQRGSAPIQPVNGSDAVFAAVAAAVWIARGLPPMWPTDHQRSA